MVKLSPTPIKEYYIAYFDLLGYKEYLKENKEKAEDFLNIINFGIENTTKYINDINTDPLALKVTDFKIKWKIFSDNILLCMEVRNGKSEKTRLLLFMSVVAEIQRGFVLQCGLFVRGGIVKGLLSFNDNYVFGQGVIDAVALEEKAIYPRIVIAKNIIDLLNTKQVYSEEVVEKVAEVEKLFKNGEKISNEEILNLSAESVNERWMNHIVLKWADDEYVLQYIYNFGLQDLFDEKFLEGIFQAITVIAPNDVEAIKNYKSDFSSILKSHKEIIEKRLKTYGKYIDIQTGEAKSAEIREKILLKYVWVMAFHNHVCRIYQKLECTISAKCNCDTRFLRTTIEVIDNETRV